MAQQSPILLFVALLLALVSASPARFTEPKLCCGWNDVNSALLTGAISSVKLSFNCKQQNIAELKEIALAVSDPKNSRYGQHLTKHQVDDLTAPLPEHTRVVKQWLTKVSSEVHVVRNRLLSVVVPVAAAEQLLNTKFRHVKHSKTGQVALRASTFQLPAEVAAAVDSVYGPHGLPAPRRNPRWPVHNATTTASPLPEVTPSVLRSTYHVGGVTPSGSSSNRQAVAEFQGQMMEPSDLATFFKKFVPGAAPGDDTVYKFVDGGSSSSSAGVEASLDIQYIMGVAPGIKTEFWYYGGSDFCADVKDWTAAQLAAANPPNVQSVSYGIQGKLASAGCSTAQVAAIDNDFAALAARGVSLVIASGDSGSGFANPTDICLEQSTSGKELLGFVKARHQFKVGGTFSCCAAAGADASTFAQTAVPPPLVPVVEVCVFPGPGGDGQKDTALSGRVIFSEPNTSPANCCMLGGNTDIAAWTSFPNGTCVLFGEVSGKGSSPGAFSAYTRWYKQSGNCTVFSQVTGSIPAPTTTHSCEPLSLDGIYPSWPASSPWVTAVGATQFQGSSAEGPEMAVSNFGSGGGFSSLFPRSPNATFQSDDVTDYLNSAPRTAPFPPQSWFPAGGRATPDVSALGDGFQVVANGKVEGVGGTSASTPSFAAMVSLLNEARLQKGKAPLGFLNPFLYAAAGSKGSSSGGFTDITVGTNAITRYGQKVTYGYTCTEGWDPVTGLGTPLFDRLLTAALQAP